jgi:hypothetical protein
LVLGYASYARVFANVVIEQLFAFKVRMILKTN